MKYALPWPTRYVEQLYPDPRFVSRSTGLTTFEQVIAHFTGISLQQDLIDIEEPAPRVHVEDDRYVVDFTPKPGFEAAADAFGAAHVAFLDPRRGGLAIAGADACRATPMWNPMTGYPVNGSDGPCEWLPCLPVGLPLVNHRAVILMHYPPIVAYRNADYLNNNTLRRWAQILECVGIEDPTLYHNIIDVNPIAAPGSGQSAYANDFFPIALTSMFYDDEPRGLTYVRSMLEQALDPPWNRDNPYTLPLLVCGSPLYDPQAAGWFRVRYADQLPKDAHGSPTVNVGQVGTVRINEHSRKLTPYMVANHMIAAGVTGRCTNDPTRIPDIRKYEAQDLVAASFLAAYHEDPSIGPETALRKACQRWFGADDGSGPPAPPAVDDQLTVCALAQWDSCFDLKKLLPMYTYEQARERCRVVGGKNYGRCFGCGPVQPIPLGRKPAG